MILNCVHISGVSTIDLGFLQDLVAHFPQYRGCGRLTRRWTKSPRLSRAPTWKDGEPWRRRITAIEFSPQGEEDQHETWGFKLPWSSASGKLSWNMDSMPILMKIVTMMRNYIDFKGIAGIAHSWTEVSKRDNCIFLEECEIIRQNWYTSREQIPAMIL